MAPGSIAMARRYARAVSRAAGDSSLEQLLDEMSRIAQVIPKGSELWDFLKSPVYPDEVKWGAILEIFPEAQNGSVAYKVLKVITEARRIDLLPLIVEELRSVHYNKLAVIPVTVVSTRDLDPQEKNDISLFLTQKLGGEPLVEWHQDISIMGGILIRQGDRVMDCTLRTQVEKMRRSLLEDVG